MIDDGTGFQPDATVPAAELPDELVFLAGEQRRSDAAQALRESAAARISSRRKATFAPNGYSTEERASRAADPKRVMPANWSRRLDSHGGCSHVNAGRHEPPTQATDGSANGRTIVRAQSRRGAASSSTKATISERVARTPRFRARESPATGSYVYASDPQLAGETLHEALAGRLRRRIDDDNVDLVVERGESSQAALELGGPAVCRR